MSVKTTAGDPPAKKKGKALILGLVAALLIAGGGGAAAWVFMKPAGNDDPLAQAAQAKPQDPVFMPLEQFTVNLADEGGDRMAQIALTLELAQNEAKTVLDTRMPAVRNEILLLLSASRSDEVLTVAGKQKLAGQIAHLAGSHLGWQPTLPGSASPVNASGPLAEIAAERVGVQSSPRPNPVLAVHFSHFIVQ